MSAIRKNAKKVKNKLKNGPANAITARFTG